MFVFLVLLRFGSGPHWFLGKKLEDKIAGLEVPSVRFARARPDTFEISSHHWVPSQGAPKQFINIDNDYRTSIDSLTQFKAYESGSKACKHPSVQDPREVPGL